MLVAVAIAWSAVAMPQNVLSGDDAKDNSWYAEQYAFDGRYSLTGFELKHKEASVPFIDEYGQFMYKEWPGKIHTDRDLLLAREEEEALLQSDLGPATWNQYGGWKNGPKQKATGHFRVEKIRNVWWLIDPEGALFWSVGPVRVSATSGETPLVGHESWFASLPDRESPLAEFYDTHDALLRPYYERWKQTKTFDFSGANLYRKYGPKWREHFMQLVHKRLRAWGMNTIANGSELAITAMNRTPYVERIEVVSKPLAGSPGLWRPMSDPFDPSFRDELKRQLALRHRDVGNPWCIGLFVDNELGWGGPGDVARYTLKAPGDQEAKHAFCNFLKEKYKSIDALNDRWQSSFPDWQAWLANRELPGEDANDDLLAFSAVFTETYFKTIREEFTNDAPGLMYLGCRFAGIAGTEHIVKTAANYVDVLSFNIYAKNVDTMRLPEGVDKPVLIGEFHFGALDRGPLHGSQVVLKNQEERAAAWTQFANSALNHRQIVGMHWHQYGDQATSGRFDGENFQNGLVDVADTPYKETLASSRKTGNLMYRARYRRTVFCDGDDLTWGEPRFKPSLYAALPEDMFGPDALCYDKARKILYLSVPNFIRGTNGLCNAGSFLARVYPNGQVQKLLEFPLIDGNYVGCMGMDLGPDGHLYVCDMQYFSHPEYQSRVLRVVMEDGQPTGEVETVVQGLKVANAVMWDERGMFVTDTILDLPGRYGSGAVWLFEREEILTAGRNGADVLRVAKQDDPRQIIIEDCDDIGNGNNCGADGITKDSNGIYYFGNYGDGAMYRFIFDETGCPVVEKIHQGGTLFNCVDGICYEVDTNRVYITDSSENSIWALKPSSWGEPVTFELLWENEDTTGEGGLLDLPCECRMVEGQLVIVNQDEGVGAAGKNQQTDRPYSLSVMTVQ
ncbi:MAG: beta-galactosidase [Planctomycetia bacterium]|nr:beta-galactosidase [Planctomycetia bacterium]